LPSIFYLKQLSQKLHGIDHLKDDRSHINK